MKKILLLALISLSIIGCSKSPKLDNEVYTLKNDTLIVHHVPNGINVDKDLKFVCTNRPLSSLVGAERNYILNKMNESYTFHLKTDMDTTLLMLAVEVQRAVTETKEDHINPTSIDFPEGSVGHIEILDSVIDLSFIFSGTNRIGAQTYVDRHRTIFYDDDTEAVQRQVYWR